MDCGDLRKSQVSSLVVMVTLEMQFSKFLLVEARALFNGLLCHVLLRKEITKLFDTELNLLEPLVRLYHLIYCIY